MAIRALTVLASDFRHGKSAPKPPGPRHGKPCSDDLTLRLYHAVTGADPECVTRAATELQKSGIRNHDIKVSIVPAIARRLGEDWINDTQGFSGVTIGCARLQSIVRHLPDDPPQIHPANRREPMRCLVVVPEGTQHTLGALVLTELLRHAGAAAELAIGVSDLCLSRMVRGQRFDAVMISASQDLCVKALRKTVKAARLGGFPSKVVIGGGILETMSDLVATTGTDYLSKDMAETLDFCMRDGIPGQGATNWQMS